MAEKEIPKSYKDPFWQNLAADAGRRAGLPDGLLPSILNHGERTNADQTSSAGAKTPFQILPVTRDAVLKKYGVDAYVSPQAAADAAALLLKEAVQRNKGDVAAAVGEYHGGTNRGNWGRLTRGYINRVMVGSGLAKKGGSTFDVAVSKMQSDTPPAPSIAAIYDAYKSGQMTEQEAREFESDVKSGAVMLPRGASLGTGATQAATQEPVELPYEVTQAYRSGKMSEQERADLESDMKAGLVKLPPLRQDLIPGASPDWQAPTQQGIMAPPAKEPTLGERLVGTAEAIATTASGATTGTLGMIGGTVEGIAKTMMDGTFGTAQGVRQAEEIAMQRAGQATYAPRTEAGASQAAAVGQAFQAAMPVMPLAGEMAMLGQAGRLAAPGVRAGAEISVQGARDAVQAGLQQAKPRVAQIVQTVREAPQRAAAAVGLGEAPAPAVRPASPYGSVGSAGVTSDVLRTAKAESLPVPVKLTKGAETREAGQLAFEKEQMKNPELGAPLRARAEENNLQALANFDALIDMTAAEAPDIASTGNAVTKALAGGYQAAKNKTRAAYTKAKNSPEAMAEVDTGTVVQIGEGENAVGNSLVGYVNSQPRGTSPVADKARTFLKARGLAEETADGVLVPKKATVRQMDEFRQDINGVAGFDAPKELRHETIIKKMVDATTEPVAGPLYKEARALRTQQARKYESRAVVARLVQQVRGMDDPRVAADQVFNKSVMTASPEEITFLKRVLTTSGDDGRQAWSELKGALVRHIKDEATRGMGMDSADRPIISPAKLHATVSALDKNGRLDIVLGKKSAQIVRDLNDVVRYVNTSPPGTLINNSGTVGTLLAAMGEAGATGALTGLPLPVMSGLRALQKQINNKRVQAKINDALNVKKPAGGGKF